MSEHVLTSGDLITQTKGATGAARQAEGRKSAGIPYEEFVKGIEDPDLRAQFEIQSRKAIGSTDVNGYRLVSLVPNADVLRNEETVALNIAESNAPVVATDINLRIRERRVGAGTAEFFNPDGALPGGRQSFRPFRTQTIGFAGNLLDIKFLPQELTSQSPVESIDLVAQEIEDEVVVLRRFMNAKILSNTEVTSEMAPTGTQPGGFIDRSTANALVVGPGADFTNPIIQGRVDAIANATSNEGLGYNLPLVCLVRAGQLAKVRDLMIARYPGENSDAHAKSIQAMMDRLAAVNVPVDASYVYKPTPGRPVLFLHEGQMPTGTALFFDPSRLQLARFRMFGQTGPWVLERPTSALTSLVLVWDAFAPVDRLIESRAKVTGLND